MKTTKMYIIHILTLLIALIIIYPLSISPAFAESVKYTCPMHTHYVSAEDGTCPICGMNLVPIKAEKDYADTSIQLPAAVIQKMGVKIAPVKMTLFGQNIRSYGVVTANPRATQVANARVSGWIEDLSITAVGDEIHLGDQLFTLYSPDLISAQQDYLAALNTGIKGRIDSSAKRLITLGMSEKVIQQLRQSRMVLDQVPFYFEPTISTPAKNKSQTKNKPQPVWHVSEVMAQPGSYIQPGTPIATLQNYANVWVQVDVAIQDLEFLSLQTPARVKLANRGDTEQLAQVDYLYPTIDAATRTGQVRLVLDNAKGLFKPGAYADVVFEANSQERLSVPAEAILKSGTGDYVVIALGKGRFKSQPVLTGITSHGRTEIINEKTPASLRVTANLEEGTNIVVSGQFLIDSESKLRESFNKLQTNQKSTNDAQKTKQHKTPLGGSQHDH